MVQEHFLSKAFEYIYNKAFVVDDSIKKLENNQLEILNINNNFTSTLDKSVLRNNIFGVDINKESVEIAKLSLWLRTANSKDSLVNLDENIKCGNSLIDDYEVAGELAFNWRNEFKDVFNREGFDIIVGNPPYIFSREKLNDKEKLYFTQKYETCEYQINTFTLFIERSIKLLNDNGILGFIIPNTLLKLDTFSKTRKYMLNHGEIVEITQLRGKHFKSASVETIIIIFRKSSKANSAKKTSIISLDVSDKQDLITPNYMKIDASEWYLSENPIFFLQNQIDKKIIFKMLKSSTPLYKHFIVKAGLQPYEINKGNPRQTKEYSEKKLYHYNSKKFDDCYPYIEGKDIESYNAAWNNDIWLKYGDNLASPRTLDLFIRPRVLVREIAGNLPNCIFAAYTDQTLLNNRSVINVLNEDDNKEKLKLLTIILNSKLISFYFKVSTSNADKIMFPKIIIKDLKLIPVVIPDDYKSYLDIYSEIENAIIELNKSVNDFIEFISKMYKVNNNSSKIKKYYECDFDVFINEIENRGVKLSVQNKFELFQVFKDSRQKVIDCKQKIGDFQNKINQKIYELYGLNKKEIDYVESRM